MKLIINTVNLRIGGAFQRSLSFLKELKDFGTDEYYVFYCSRLSEQIDINSFPKNFHFFIFRKSPANLLSRSRIIREFDRLEKKIKPDVVFSFVGPSYWRPKTTHLVGFGVPHIVYKDYSYVQNYSMKVKLEMYYKQKWTKYEADYYVVQTKDVQSRLATELKLSNNKVFLVSNGIGNQYKKAVVNMRKQSFVKKLLLISTYRPSKNFEIIKDVLPLLKKSKYKYEFHITISDDIYQKIFGDNQTHVINHGHVFAEDCPNLYNSCDAMFLPSFLECFSASYPEAMKMKKPILTSNLSFAKSICGNAAIYFDNTDPEDIAEKIINLFNDENLYQSLISAGELQLKSFDDSRTQAEKYIKICHEIAQDEKHVQ